MGKSILPRAFRRDLIPTTASLRRKYNVGKASPVAPPFGRVTIRHVMWTPLEDRYPDAPKLFTDPANARLPYPEELKTPDTRPGRMAYRVYETRRFDTMIRLLLEEVMDNEIALRRGALPVVEWNPGGSVVWTPELACALFEHLANGGTFLTFANEAGISRAAVVAFARREDVAPQVARAAALGVDAMAEAALEVADKPCQVEEVIETVAPDGSLLQKNVRRRDHVEARKLAYQSRMQYLSKIAPNKYGERPEAEETVSMAEKILKARNRLAGA